jgi:hypothetical protein
MKNVKKIDLTPDNVWGLTPFSEGKWGLSPIIQAQTDFG